MLFDLEYDEVNLVLKALSTQPYIDVYSIISKIHDQHENGVHIREEGIAECSPVEDAPHCWNETIGGHSPHPNDYLSWLDKSQGMNANIDTDVLDFEDTGLFGLSSTIDELIENNKKIVRVDDISGDGATMIRIYYKEEK